MQNVMVRIFSTADSTAIHISFVSSSQTTIPYEDSHDQANLVIIYPVVIKSFQYIQCFILNSKIYSCSHKRTMNSPFETKYLCNTL